MAEGNNLKDVKLSNNDNQASSTASSDFDRLEDCNEAEFRGATLSLSQETSPTASFAPSPNALANEDVNANVTDEANSGAGADRQRSSSIRLPHRSEVQDFFAIREGALQKAAEQCEPVILENLDGSLRGIWLLTEIDHWDTEKERMIFLADNSLISLKYDFITLRLLDYKRLPLTQFEQMIVGELKYPEKSLMPKINGAMDFVKQRIVQKIRQGKNFQPSASKSQRLTIVSGRISTRNQLGVQCSWNHLQQVPVLKRWNPWSRDIPWITYTSHPLLKTDTGSSNNYDIEDFSKRLVEAVENLKRDTGPNTPEAPSTTGNSCQILYQPIIIESYAGVVAALHNANEFGFFKSRGKVSF